MMNEHKKIYLDKEYDYFMNKILNGDNFMLLRYGDGERSIMMGKKVVAQEGWTSPEEITNLGRALLSTLNHDEENVYYGISCPCCDSSAYFWYCQNIKSKNKTFANMFVNRNYRRFINDFEKIRRDAIVIANKSGVNNKIGNLNILKYYPVGDSCQDFWNKEAEIMLKNIVEEFGSRENLLYVVSAGPLSEPILHYLYDNNPNNCYIDFGSCLDRYIHKEDTRPYTDPNSDYGRRNCWMFDNDELVLDISVVLTAYKKPDALVRQLDAIEKQTIKPKEVFLFQDGIADNYEISFKENVLSRFTDCMICKENFGVWKRFEYAKNICKSKYVCIFDDDTIPGERWFENCFLNMQEQEGVYGTVGIIVQDYTKYPDEGHTRVGWTNPYKKRAHVDFVGHSWFIKKEYLEYMFEGTEKYQKFKRAGEDMCLSFKCQQHGIDTFVPPHPYNDLSLWGSLPKYGNKYGNDPTAISKNSAGCKYMEEAITEMVNDGWKFVIDNNHQETMNCIKDIKHDYYESVFNRVKEKLYNIKTSAFRK